MANEFIRTTMDWLHSSDDEPFLCFFQMKNGLNLGVLEQEFFCFCFVL